VTLTQHQFGEGTGKSPLQVPVCKALNIRDNPNAAQQNFQDSNSKPAFAFTRGNFLTQRVIHLTGGNSFLELLLTYRRELGTGEIV